MMRHLSDEALIRRMKDGDIQSFDVLYRRHAAAVLTFITRVIKDREHAEDLTQNVFMRLFIKRKSLDSSTVLRRWLFVCARNEAIDYLRSKWASDVTHDWIGDIAAPDMEEAILRKDEAEAMTSVIESLPEKRARVLRLSKMMDVSNTDIAEEMGISVRTVEKHLELGMKDLRKKLN